MTPNHPLQGNGMASGHEHLVATTLKAFDAYRRQGGREADARKNAFDCTPMSSSVLLIASTSSEMQSSKAPQGHHLETAF